MQPGMRNRLRIGSDLLNDECGHFRRGNNYGVECTGTQRQRLLLDSGRGGSEPYSGRAFRVADRTASASTLQSVVHKLVSSFGENHRNAASCFA